MIMVDQVMPLSKEHRQQLFFKSATDGDLNQIKSLFNDKRITDVDIRDNQGWTALMLASRNGHHEMVKYLLHFGANAKLVNKSGQTALQIAEFWSHSECCKSLQQNDDDMTKSQAPEVVNFFGHGLLDRQALRRGDKSWLDSTMKEPSTKYILLSKQNVYAMPPSADNRKYSLCSYSYSQVNQLMNTSEKTINLPIILLGSEGITDGRRSRDGDDTDTGTSDGNETVWFAVDVTAVDSGEIEKLNPGAELLGSNLISLMGFDESQAGILAQGISILNWHDRYKYCPTCGSNTAMEEAGYKRTCENSDCRSRRGIHNTSYPRLDPVAIMLVIHPDGDKCLLGRKKMFPKGMYSCLAGFMEPGESIEDAVRREVKEESGILVGRVQYHSSQPWPMPSQVMIGCLAWATSTDITIDQQELEEAKWFSRQDVFEAVVHGHKGFSDRGGTGMFVPPRQAIAHQLIKAWATTSANL
ncbi:NAD-capped RNA hydrolase NUDT12-like isoform X1 [Apostichopus japonicus]|uniref:NAD-capped RNA hydrolase NUDT12-like isoform X1 n=2 Tax=Stichopus japonicus TaxID=307972 RepID=UPI003AB19134